MSPTFSRFNELVSSVGSGFKPFERSGVDNHYETKKHQGLSNWQTHGQFQEEEKMGQQMIYHSLNNLLRVIVREHIVIFSNLKGKIQK